MKGISSYTRRLMFNMKHFLLKKSVRNLHALQLRHELAAVHTHKNKEKSTFIDNSQQQRRTLSSFTQRKSLPTIAINLHALLCSGKGY